MDSSSLTSLHAWIDNKDQLRYLLFDETGTHIGADVWPSAGRVTKELRADFPDKFFELGGKDRIDPFLRSVTRDNATPANPAVLTVFGSSIDLAGSGQRIETTPGTTEVAYHDFSF